MTLSRVAIVQVRSSQEVGTDHLQTVTTSVPSIRAAVSTVQVGPLALAVTPTDLSSHLAIMR
jgi:hypothetical protein